MIERQISSKLIELSKYFSVVTIVGPRQSGKTTLTKQVFSDYNYVNLENLSDYTLAKTDYVSFFKKYPYPLIIDEIQLVPELLHQIQVISDSTKQKGIFILTGSHQPLLHEKISQSLAGRTALLKLLPLSINELNKHNIILDRDEYIFNGFMPRIYDENIPADLLYPAYLQTYVEKDVRQIINIGNIHLFQKFIKLLAGRVGQPVNLASLANDTGVSSTTINSWISLLEACYIIFTLPCYFQNFGKRITKAPKIYFTDTGLVTSLLGITNKEMVSRDPLLGGLFENMVITEVLKLRLNQGFLPELYYYKIQNRQEIDLFINLGNFLVPIEIKSSRTFTPEFSDNIKRFMKFCPNCKFPCVIYAGEDMKDIQGVNFINYKNIADYLSKIKDI